MLTSELSFPKEGEVSSPLLIIICELLGKAQNKGHSLDFKATALLFQFMSFAVQTSARRMWSVWRVTASF